MVISIKEDKGKKKGHAICKSTMNLSDFADMGGALKTTQLSLKRKGSKIPVIVTVWHWFIWFVTQNIDEDIIREYGPSFWVTII